jgi:succinate dehydrogenase/fumarate reductase flavoprotein subunit
MLPLQGNFFRSEDALTRSLARLDAAWAALRRHLPEDGRAAVKSREAAALTATGRWAYRSALARGESRGMHRRVDLPDTDPTQVCAYVVTGLDRVEVTRYPTVAP